MDTAKRKLNEGTYGVCEECGKDISEERLAALS
jgi:RNA polymerase-binding transcription factor DksA